MKYIDNIYQLPVERILNGVDTTVSAFALFMSGS